VSNTTTLCERGECERLRSDNERLAVRMRDYANNERIIAAACKAMRVSPDGLPEACRRSVAENERLREKLRELARTAREFIVRVEQETAERCEAIDDSRDVVCILARDRYGDEVQFACGGYLTLGDLRRAAEALGEVEADA